jgi:hypothetical protein
MRLGKLTMTMNQKQIQDYIFVESVKTQLLACNEGLWSRGQGVFYTSIEEAQNLFGKVEREDKNKYVSIKLDYQAALPVIKGLCLELLQKALDGYNRERFSHHYDSPYDKPTEKLMKFIKDYFQIEGPTFTDGRTSKAQTTVAPARVEAAKTVYKTEATRREEIRKVAERIRDTDLKIVTRLEEQKRDGDSVSRDIRTCANFLWEIEDSVNDMGEFVHTYERKTMTSDQAISKIKWMAMYRLKYAADPGDQKTRYGSEIETYLDETLRLVRELLTRNENLMYYARVPVAPPGDLPPERQREADITYIAELLRALDIFLDEARRKDEHCWNSVTAAMHRYAAYFWKKNDKDATQYELKKLTTEEKIQLIEQIRDRMPSDSWWHKKGLLDYRDGSDIVADIDEISKIVKDFLSRNESEKSWAERLQKEAKREAEEQAAEVMRAAAEVKRIADEEERRELNRQRILEEAQDLLAEPAWTEARQKLVQELQTVHKTYERLAKRLGDEISNIPIGGILGGQIQLSHYIATQTYKRTEDTYLFCQLLRNCTCYLACDDKYKREGHPSKNDRFKRIYKNNYHFRRKWVAFLSQIVAYVEMLYEHEEDAGKKLYLTTDKLASMHYGLGDTFWLGRGGYPYFAWANIKQDITTAQEAIDKEPKQAPATNWLPLDWHRKALLDGGADVRGQRTQRVQDLLDELRQV